MDLSSPPSTLTTGLPLCSYVFPKAESSSNGSLYLYHDIVEDCAWIWRDLEDVILLLT